jgi:cell division protease FtsH
MKQTRFSPWYWLILFWLGWLGYSAWAESRDVQTLSFSEFQSYLEDGRIAEARVGDDLIEGKLKDPEAGEPSRFVTVPVDPEIADRLATRGVEVSGRADGGFLSTLAMWMLPLLLIVLVWTFVLRRLSGKNGLGGGLLSVGKSRAKIYVERDVGTRFDDVAGVDEAKAELEEVIEYLKTPEKFMKLGGRIPKGFLLVGAPGTGKTLLAKAVAGEAGVPFFSISGSDFVEMFVGVGAARVRDLFEQAKQKAPCIIFIDELDALGRARGSGPASHEEREQTLNQLLVEMDGFDSRTGVILMAATNRPEILDPALLRAGRFDRHIAVDRPDREGRLAILRVHARSVALEDEADLEAIAAMTPGFVGADLENIINTAALLAVRHGRDTVGASELTEAVERLVAGLEKKNRVLNEAEKRRVAIHEIGHALLGLLLPGSERVQKISIIPRGVGALGYTLRTPTEDRYLMTESELEDRAVVLLGGRVAEALVYDEVSTGAQDDLRKVTDIARSMVQDYGMSGKLGQVSLRRQQSTFLGAGPSDGADEFSEQTAREIDEEVRRIVDEQYQRARSLLAERMPLLLRAAARLLEQETLSGDELQALVDASSAPHRDGTTDQEIDVPERDYMAAHR